MLKEAAAADKERRRPPPQPQQGRAEGGCAAQRASQARVLGNANHA